jgi:hypothetical protein
MKTLMLSFALVVCCLVICQGQLEWTYTELSEPRECLVATSLGNKAFFAGGGNENEFLTAVEVYDVASKEWEIIGNLSAGRDFPTGISCGSKVFFAGGVDLGQQMVFAAVDIYDTLSRQWEVEELSVARFGIAAVSYGSKVFFAGGTSLPWVTTNIIDIYDIETGDWTTDTLSVARGGIAATVVGDLAIFAGGSTSVSVNSSRVDIYNFTTGSWSTAELSQARADASATTVGDKALIAGGFDNFWNSLNRVDIFDYSTGQGIWSIDSLSYPRASMGNAATVCNKACFAGGGDFYYGFMGPSNVIDIYDDETISWSVENLAWPLINHAVTGVGENLIIAGGSNDIAGIVSTVSIGTDTTCFWTHVPAYASPQSSVVSYPNPTNGIFNVQFTVYYLQRITLRIYDVNGREVAVLLDEDKPAGEHTVRYDASGLPAGIYLYRLTSFASLRMTGDDCRLTTSSGKLVKY